VVNPPGPEGLINFFEKMISPLFWAKAFIEIRQRISERIVIDVALILTPIFRGQ
jgi:hypothetical protein